MRTQAVYAALAACLSVAPAALAQKPQTQHLPRNGGDNVAPWTPKQQMSAEQATRLVRSAATDLHTGRYAQAEGEAREALSLMPEGVAAEVLAAALDAQGKEKEALQAYQTVVKHYDRQSRNLLPYALLLLKSGQWNQALALYNQALPHLPSVGPHPEMPIVQDGEVMGANSHFSPDTPEPTALAAAIHIARGLVYDGSCD